MKKVTDLIQKVKKLGNLIRLPWFLPRLYLKILAVGLILVGLNFSYVQNLTYCSNLFEANFCSPIGIYLIAFASIPGYLIVNAILPQIAAENDSLYSLIVFVTSLLVYSLLGYLFSKRKHIQNKSTGFVYLVFLFLLFAVLMLVSLIRG